MSRRIAPADGAVLAAAEAAHVEVTARQLERWRQSGAIPKPRRTSLHKSRWSASEYTAEETNYIIEFARRSRRRRQNYRVVLWVFLDEHHVPDDCLRWAYGELIAVKRQSLLDQMSVGEQGGIFVDNAGLGVDVIGVPGDEPASNEPVPAGVLLDLESIDRAARHAPYPAIYLGLLLMRRSDATGAASAKSDALPSVDESLRPLMVMLAHKYWAAERAGRDEISYDAFVAAAFEIPAPGPRDGEPAGRAKPRPLLLT